MQKVFSAVKMPDAPVGGLFLLQDSTLQPKRVCEFFDSNLPQFGSDAPSLIGGNAFQTQEASA